MLWGALSSSGSLLNVERFNHSWFDGVVMDSQADDILSASGVRSCIGTQLLGYNPVKWCQCGTAYPLWTNGVRRYRTYKSRVTGSDRLLAANQYRKERVGKGKHSAPTWTALVYMVEQVIMQYSQILTVRLCRQASGAW